MLRAKRNPAGLGGTSYTLTEPDDLIALPKRARSVVTAGLRKLFLEYPAGLMECARRQLFLPLSSFLQSASHGVAVLEVQVPEYAAPSAALTILDNLLRRRFSFTGPGEMFPVIEPLSSLYGAVGGVSLDFMRSGSIFSPDRVMSLAEFRAQFEDTHIVPKQLTEGWAFYEVDGDYLFCNSSGQTYWLGRDHCIGKSGSPHLQLVEAIANILSSIERGVKYCSESPVA